MGGLRLKRVFGGFAILVGIGTPPKEQQRLTARGCVIFADEPPRHELIWGR